MFSRLRPLEACSLRRRAAPPRKCRGARGGSGGTRSRCCRRRHRRRRRRHGGQEQAANQGQPAGERGRGAWRGRPRASGARGSVPPCARGRRSPVPRRGSAIIGPGCGSWGRGWARGRLSALVVLLGSVAAAAPVVFVRRGAAKSPRVWVQQGTGDTFGVFFCAES